VLCASPTLALADAYQQVCDKGGDQLGSSIATNGDFNGDGVADIAIGSPCMFVRGHIHAGAVIIIDGRNGRPLFRKKGGYENQWFGAAVSFLPDLNGDGRDEIAIGSPGYDVTIADQHDPHANLLDRAGRVDVYQKRHRRMRIFGTHIRAGFGEKIAPLNDINGDGRADFVVSASGDRNENDLAQPGRVYTVSGRNGDLLAYRIGPKGGNSYGRSLASATDLDGDGLFDFLAGSDEANVPGVLRSGVVHALSSADPASEPIFEVSGAAHDRIGKSVDFAGDVNDDDVPDLITGSDASDDTGVKLSGLVSLFSLDGTRLWVRHDTKMQDGARFGSAVARIGDINGDGVTDFAATAPRQDFLIEKRFTPDAGRLVTLSGVDGTEIWSLDGVRRYEEFGYALDGDIDFNLDEVPDMVIGTPGDDPTGRRGAGTVKILSGIDGSTLLTVNGRRGLETRIATVSYDHSENPKLRTFSRTGRRTEMSEFVLEGMTGELSLSILNDKPFDAQGDPHVPKPRSVQVAVTGGFGSDDSKVEVYRMAHGGELQDSFDAFDGNVSVECGAGEVNGRVNEDLVCSQADGGGGDVFVRTFERLDEGSSYFFSSEFQAFSAADMWNTIPINAEGATVTVGNVTGDKQDEIIVGTTRGVPVVRIFTRDGVLIRTFLAYDPVDFSGVDVALVDLDGSGDQQIVTAPREGQAIVKVFNGNGDRVTYGPEFKQINIVVRPAEDWVHGARVGAADVDLDDQQEILVMLPGPEGHQEVRAYESNGNPVKHFANFDPLPGGEGGAGDIAGTDRWVRR